MNNLKASSSRRRDGQRISVDRLLSDSKVRFLNGSLYCTWYRCSRWLLEVILVVSFSPPVWLSPRPWPSSWPWEVPSFTPWRQASRSGAMTPEVLGFISTSDKSRLQTSLNRREWSARASDALTQFPVEDLPWQAIGFRTVYIGHGRRLSMSSVEMNKWRIYGRQRPTQRRMIFSKVYYISYTFGILRCVGFCRYILHTYIVRLTRIH